MTAPGARVTILYRAAHPTEGVCLLLALDFAMSTVPTRNPRHTLARTGGVLLGIIVFLLGIGLIGDVFVTAHTMFLAPPPVIPTTVAATPAATANATDAAASAAPAATAVIGATLIQFLQKLLVLFLMCIAGSLIASKGIDLFFKSLASGVSAPAPTTPAP